MMLVIIETATAEITWFHPMIEIPPPKVNCKPPTNNTTTKQRPKPARAPPIIELRVFKPCFSKKTIPAINITEKTKSTIAGGNGLSLLRKIAKSPRPMSTRKGFHERVSKYGLKIGISAVYNTSRLYILHI
jgi:hypothetical protein